MNATITAMHYCLGPERLTNTQLEERFGEKAVRSIAKLSGITERRIAPPGITAADMALCAARRLLPAREIDPASIDLIVFASQTGDYRLPATACVLHHKLGLAEHCGALDLNHGCPAFVYALATCEGFIASGRAKRILLLNAEALTQLIHPLDRGLVPLHGDGAVATLIEPAPDPQSGLKGLKLGTDSSGFAHLIVPAGGTREPSSEVTRADYTDDAGCTRSREHLFMNGTAVFYFSIHKVPEVIAQALESFDQTIEDFDLVLLHQANKTMIGQIYRKLGVPPQKQFLFSETIGNLSGASLPTVLAEAWRQDKIRAGSRTLLCGFGVGLSWGTVAIQWPEQLPAPVEASVEYEPEPDAS